jgi:hypothetical protein
MLQMFRRLGLGFSTILALATVGCGKSGPPSAHLQGTVTIAGQPIPADATATIAFEPQNTAKQGPPGSAPIVDGAYDCPQVPLGAVTVYFNISQPTGPEYTTSRGDKARNVTNLTPAKYQPGVPLDVAGDNASQNFDLTP